MKTLLDRISSPIIQGGMGVGISLGNLAGAVAREGGVGVISTANVGFRETDFWSNTAAANLRALKKEIARAREIAEGKGVIAINAMVATRNFGGLRAAGGGARVRQGRRGREWPQLPRGDRPS